VFGYFTINNPAIQSQKWLYIVVFGSWGAHKLVALSGEEEVERRE